MNLSPLLLGRVQFTVCLTFFGLFMALALALSWVLFYFRWQACRHKHEGWMAAYHFWVRIFALTFVLTLASGVPVLLQLGTIWAGFMNRIGNIAGPLLGFAVLSAFMLKSCFLSVMLFGQRQLSANVHTLFVFMVALGQLVIVFWILVLVSWMQTPTGAVAVEDHYQVFDWIKVIFNPAMGWTLGMSVVSALLAVAFLILGMMAWQALRRPLDMGERLSFRTALKLACIAILLWIPLGLGTAKMIAHYQPAKAAAAAAYWHAGDPPDWVVVGWPDADRAVTRAALKIRGAAAPWLGRDANGQFLALENDTSMQPPVALTFWSLRVVILLSILMFATAGWIFIKLFKYKFNPAFLSRYGLYNLVSMTGAGGIMVIVGWFFTLVGLQPYVVNSAITQSEVLGPVAPTDLLASTLGFVGLYSLLLVAFVRMLLRAARQGVVPVRKKLGAASSLTL